MRRAPTIKLDIPVRKELERLSRSRSVAVRLAERSRIVLLAAGGLDNQEIAAKLDITRQKAGRWRDRFVEDGLGGIEKDASRSGRIPSIGRRKRARIVKKTVEGKPPNATHWSRSLMARATGVSESTVGRIWRAHGLKPHLARTFKLSNDKQFVEKLEDVVGLYLNPPENAIVLSCDEKSQMQALDRTQPGLPLKKGRCGTLTHDYKRNGTTTMLRRSIRWTARLSGPVCRSIVIRNGSGFSIRSNVPCRKTNRSISFATTTPRTNIRKSSTG